MLFFCVRFRVISSLGRLSDLAPGHRDWWREGRAGKRRNADILFHAELPDPPQVNRTLIGFNGIRELSISALMPPDRAAV